MNFKLAHKIRTTVRRLGVDVSHAPNWSYVFSQVETVIDVGAHHGETYDYFRGMGWKGRVISFEPSSSNCKRLEGRGYDWEVRRMAISSRSGKALLNLYGESDWSHSLNKHFGAKATDQELVTVSRLDRLDMPQGKFFLKVDAEGEDLEVVKGAGELRERIPWIMLEVAAVPRYETEPGLLEVLNAMDGLGYQVAFIDRQQPFVSSPQAMDIVFSRKDVI